MGATGILARAVTQTQVEEAGSGGPDRLGLSTSIPFEGQPRRSQVSPVSSRSGGASAVLSAPHLAVSGWDSVL